MRTIPLTEITIAANRQRREFDQTALNELAESISGPAGLLHAPILRMEFDMTERGKTRYVLVSGERRLRAIESIFALGGSFVHDDEIFDAAAGNIPFTLASDLSPLEREEAEYDENIRRADLTWQERAAATARLADLRRRQAEEKGTPPPTPIDIASELGRDTTATRDTTRKEILIAPHLGNPLVAAAKSTDEAFKILRREEGNRRNAELAASIGRTFTSDVHVALNENALEWITESIDQFDVILTDPPYGIGADEFGDSGGAGNSLAHGYTDDAASFTRILSICSTELFRLAKPQAHLYWFCDIDQFHAAREAFSANGWQVHRTPIIWHKPTASRIPWPEYGPQRKWEMILYAVKGKRPVTKMACPDLIAYGPDPQMNHSAQKPVALFEDLLRRSVRPGDSVLDPFSGTGTIFAAAHALKCRATGIELDSASYAKGIERIRALSAQLEIAL